VSSLLCFIVGYFLTKLIELIFRRVRRTTTNKIFNAGEAIAAGAMAFMHGAQDGQKFMAIILLALSISPLTSTWISGSNGSYDIPLWLIVICSLTMSIGTSVGGYKIIKAVGMDMVKLEKYQGFAADMSSSVILFICSSIGLPVSTTNTKTTAIMGVGASKRMSNVNWGVAKEMIIAWVLTFPGCGLIAYFMTKLFLLIF
jgi:PiT family inorganic phosphate transporter